MYLIILGLVIEEVDELVMLIIHILEHEVVFEIVDDEIEIIVEMESYKDQMITE
jgi:hypothetical protein